MFDLVHTHAVALWKNMAATYVKRTLYKDAHAGLHGGFLSHQPLNVFVFKGVFWTLYDSNNNYMKLVINGVNMKVKCHHT